MIVRLGDLTWLEAAGRRRVLVVPVGSVEQHGPHLPLDTDTRIAAAVAEAVCAARPDRVLGPPIAYGASGEHAGFAGTLSIAQEGLEVLVVELVRSADRFAGVVLVNGHGGNGATLRRAAERLTTEGRRVLVCSCSVPGGDAHAGHAETSILLHLAPEVVRLDRIAAGDPRPWADVAPVVLERGVAAVSPNGVLGDPTGASADDGARLFAAICDRVRGEMAGWAA